MRFKIEQDGTIKTVYSDQVKAMGLGHMQVIRASNVEFCEACQNWEARTPTGELIAHGPNRDQVIADEVRVIESRL